MAKINRITALWLLKQHGPGTSTEIRKKAGLTAKNMELSNRLNELTVSKLVSKKSDPKTKQLRFAMLKEGEKVLGANRDQIMSLSAINKEGPLKKPRSIELKGRVARESMNMFTLLLQREQDYLQVITQVRDLCNLCLEEAGVLNNESSAD